MKNGKNPSVKEKKELKAAGLNPNDWLITKKLAEYYEILKRGTNQIITIRR